MARQKRTSSILKKAELRASGLSSISPNLNLGDDLNMKDYTAVINRLRKEIAAYNEILSLADRAANTVKALEKEVSTFNQKMLLGIAFKYGKDSSEYEMAGGVRLSDRKRPTRRQTSAA